MRFLRACSLASTSSVKGNSQGVSLGKIEDPGKLIWGSSRCGESFYAIKVTPTPLHVLAIRELMELSSKKSILRVFPALPPRPDQLLILSNAARMCGYLSSIQSMPIFLTSTPTLGSLLVTEFPDSVNSITGIFCLRWTRLRHN